MTHDSTTVHRRRIRPLAFVLGAMVAALSAFVLPAADAALPGGAILWQLAALALAMGTAWCGYRAGSSSSGLPVRTRRLVRLLAVGTVLLTLVWVGGVVALWLLWPR